jgi:prevent-host-death family protein
MQSMSAKEAKYGFGRLIDLARAAPVLVAKHGRPVVVVMSVEEYAKLKKYGDVDNNITVENIKAADHNDAKEN